MRNTYNNRQPIISNGSDIDQVCHVSFANIILHSFIVAVQLASTISFFILVLYFINQNALANSPGQQIQIIISIVLWAVFVAVMLSSVSKQLISLYVPSGLFLAIYAFLVLPITQLVINILEYFNNGVLAVCPFVIAMLLINIIFVTAIVFYLSRFKISNMAIKVIFIILIILCLLNSFINTLF